MIGQTISHYRITEKLGGGGMGVVYGAEDTNLGRRVAIKFLPEDLFDDEPAVERFRREARAASALNHPHICTIYDLGEHKGTPFLVMEQMEGQSLRERFAEGGFETGEALRLGDQIADALAAAHAKGIVHRDIKPDNLFVTDRGDAKVLDFGLAKEMTADENEETLTQLTKEGSTVGTLNYMSPEQILGKPVNARTDIFSLGIVLYEMLAGVHPFRKGQQMQTVDAILHEEAAPLGTVTDAPEMVTEVVARMLAKNPDERYQDLEEVRSDLEQAEPPPTTETVLVAPHERGKGFKRPIHVVAALGVIALFAFLGWLARRDEGADGSEEPVAVATTASLLGGVNPNSIAVLPFRNLSPDPENAFFADGMTEEIISRLSQLGAMTVISRTSVMRYKDSDKSLKEIGGELHVASVLEGSVRRAGDEVRITGQLIDVATEQNLWGNTYQRNLADIFAVQSEVAEEIISALQVELSPADVASLTRRPTDSLTAYDLYLRGVQYYRQGLKDDNERAIEFFDKALAEDPEFALAYAGRSKAYDERAMFYGYPRSWTDVALEDARRAVELDSDLPEAHNALGSALFSKGLLDESLDAQLRAVELDPNNRTVVSSLGNLYSEMGQPDEALRWFKRAVALNPAQSWPYAIVGLAYTDLAMNESANLWIDRAEELAPDGIVSRIIRGVNELNNEQWDGVIEEGEEILAFAPDEPIGLTIAGVGHHFAGNLVEAEEYYRRNLDGSWSWLQMRITLAQILWASDRREEALEVLAPAVEPLEKNLAEGASLWWVFYGLAQAEALQGNKEKAYEYLEKAVDAGATSYVVYRNDPCFAEFKDEERHQRLMADIEERIDQMRFRVEARERGG